MKKNAPIVAGMPKPAPMPVRIGDVFGSGGWAMLVIDTGLTQATCWRKDKRTTRIRIARLQSEYERQGTIVQARYPRAYAAELKRVRDR